MENKKNIEIFGWPIYPIQVGQYAWIQETDGLRRTSPVVNMEQVSKTEICFETVNTLYHLRLAQR